MARRKYTDFERQLMKTMAYNLRKILDRKKINQKELSQLTGLSTSVISDYLTEKTLMSPGIIQLISDKLNIVRSEINPNITSSNNTLRYILIVESVIKSKNSYIEYLSNGSIQIPNTWISDGEYICFVQKDDSMVNARIFEGDLLLIRYDDNPIPNDIFLVLVNQKLKMCRIVIDENIATLHYENFSYSSERYDLSQIKIIGKLIKLIRNF